MEWVNIIYCDIYLFRYGISPRAGAMCGSATLEDVGLITPENQTLVISR
jgi:hypothetical protein